MMKYGIFGAVASVALLSTPVSQALDISTQFSEDALEKIRSDYGEREIEVLSDKLDKILRASLSDLDVDVEKIEAIIEDVKPNRPTFEQLSDRPGLDGFLSRSLGGATVTAKVYSGSGDLINEYNAKYYSNDLRDVRVSAVWGDATRAFRRIAHKISKSQITAQP